ncbi:Low-affinity potassium transport protein [Tolypocladium capitatum]|uniref:Low-affinity potassium transport protein n=1 Tax=Tolypocladium capitatum TaxID=45235 RepID=A0A2K3QEB5_9HYPO|nr:Low-affinity potassium transport protein [Tolypocladium capitatum]
MGLLSLPVLYPYGNLSAVDAYFFGASVSTESGLNTYDINNLALYQQLYIYFIPMFTNLGFVNIIVVIVRLHWFNKRISKSGRSQGKHTSRQCFPACMHPGLLEASSVRPRSSAGAPASVTC